MKSSVKKSHLCLMVCLTILASYTVAQADDQAPKNNSYRQEIRDRLKTLQSNLDLMLANGQLTPDQYKTESDKIRQFRVQIHADSQEQEPMTKEDRNTDLQLIRQIKQEVSQWAVANSSGVPVSQNIPMSDLQSQYTILNNQYQSLDAKYLSAVSAGDFQTAQTIKTQQDAIRQQMEDLRSKMQQQISPTTNP